MSPKGPILLANVLTLYRGNKVIPNPRSDRVLEPDDKLLCFGKLESMRGMIPKKTRKRRRPDVQDLVSTELGEYKEKHDE